MIELTKNKVAVVPLFDTLKVGSLYIPEQARERCDQGIVKYIGPECEEVKLGDHVLFSGYTGTLLELEGEGLLIILPEDFITCTISYNGQEVDNIEISGLYFKALDGTYFQATYEQAMNLIAKGIEESKWWQEHTAKALIRKKRNEDKPKLSSEDYAKLR